MHNIYIYIYIYKTETSKGNILQLKPNKGQQISEKFQEIADEHGEIIHIYVGMGIDLIFLTGTNVSSLSIK